jgi:hypothetical protein
MRNNEVHVVNKEGCWIVEVTGQGPTGDDFETQQDAIEAGRALAKREQKELVIHGEDGAIRQKDSYGGDPRDIPG